MGTILAVVLVLLALNVAMALMVVALRTRNERKAARLGAIERRWEPIVIEAMLEDGAPIISPARHEAGHVLTIISRFARRVRGAEYDRLAELAAPLLPLAVARLTDRSEGARADAVETLSMFAFEEHVDEIVMSLDDRSDHVAIVAARALCGPGKSEFVPMVLERLHRFSDVSASMLTSLFVAVGPKALPELRAFSLDRSTRSRERVIVANALRELRDLESAAIAREFVHCDDPEVIGAGLRLLRTVGNDDDADAVRVTVDLEPFFVRAEAMRALGALGDESDQYRLLSGLHDSSPWVVIRSAEAMARLGWDDLLADEALGSGPAAMAAREALDQRGQ